MSSSSCIHLFHSSQEGQSHLAFCRLGPRVNKYGGIGDGTKCKVQIWSRTFSNVGPYLQASPRYHGNAAHSFVILTMTLQGNSLLEGKKMMDIKVLDFPSLVQSFPLPDGDGNPIVLYRRLKTNVLWIKGRGMCIPLWSLTPRPFPFTSQLLSPSEYFLGHNGWPFPSGINQSTPDNFLKHLTPFPVLSPFSLSPWFASLFKTAGHSSLMLEGQTQLDSKTLHKNTFDLQKSLHLS